MHCGKVGFDGLGGAVSVISEVIWACWAAAKNIREMAGVGLTELTEPPSGVGFVGLSVSGGAPLGNGDKDGVQLNHRRTLLTSSSRLAG
jgi:hypothetical protein